MPKIKKNVLLEYSLQLYHRKNLEFIDEVLGVIGSTISLKFHAIPVWSSVGVVTYEVR